MQEESIGEDTAALLHSGASTHYQGDDEQNEEDDEQNLGDRRGQACNAPKSEEGGDERDDEKKNR